MENTMDPDLRETLQEIRAATTALPSSICGRKHDVYDLLIDAGAKPQSGHGNLTSFVGLDVFFNEGMADGVVQIRDRDDQPLVQYVKQDDGWLIMDMKHLRLPPERD